MTFYHIIITRILRIIDMVCNEWSAYSYNHTFTRLCFITVAHQHIMGDDAFT